MQFGNIFLAGHRGLAGSAVLRALDRRGCANVLIRTREELDLEDSAAVRGFLQKTKPEAVIIAAAKVGGIQANDRYPVEFLLQNVLIQNNLISGSYEAGVKKVLFLGSSCIYPKFAPQPIPEESLLTGPLEPTNEAYAIAKITGIKLCQAYAREYGANFISVMPTNLYGPGDNFNLESSHVLPALLRKAHEAKLNGASELVVWGTGAPRREFLYCDDLAEALLFLLNHYDQPEIINVGWEKDVSIRELSEIICEITGFSGKLRFDQTKPDGTPQKLLSTAKLRKLGWEPKIGLREGIRRTYEWFLENRRVASR
jgi:GDP-L-fucose synthase